MKNTTFTVFYSTEDGLWFAVANSPGASHSPTAAAKSPDAALKALVTSLSAVPVPVSKEEPFHA